MSIWPLDRAAFPLLLVLVATAFSFSLGFLWTEELWWYLAGGAFILDAGEIPAHDPFLYSLDPPAPWLTHSWLWTVLLAGLERVFGLGALPVLGSLLVAGIVVLIYTRARVDRYGLVNAVMVALVLVAGLQRFSLRAGLPGWLLLVVFVLVLERERLTWRSVLLLALLQALWANLHAGFVLGLVVAALYSFGALLQAPLARRFPLLAPAPTSRENAGLSRVWLLPTLALASLASTPRLAGQRIHDALEVVRRAVSAVSSEVAASTEVHAIVEWRSSFDPLFSVAPWLHVALLLLGLASFAAARHPLRVSRLLLFVATALLAAWAIRFLCGFGIAVALTVIANLQDPAPWLRQRLSRLWAAPTRAVYQLVALAFAVSCLFVASSTWAARSQLEVGQSDAHYFTLNPRHSSPGAVRFILENDLPGPIYNEQALGGYLVHALYPKYQLFIDGRILDYDLLAEQTRILNTPGGWRRASRQYGFKTVVLSNLARALVPLRGVLLADPSWQLVYLDPQASIFVRLEEGASKWEPQIRDAGEGSEQPPFIGGLENSWSRRGSKVFVGTTGLEQMGIYLGVLLQLGRYAAVVDLADKVLASVPGDGVVRSHRAFALVRLARFEEAEADFRSVLEARPEDPQVLRNHAIVLQRLGREAEARDQLEKLRGLR
jgi:hypothetical protein